MDDIALAILLDLTTNILNVFNSFHYKLQFMTELGGGTWNFFDITIKIMNNTIEFNWYYKPIFLEISELFLSLFCLSEKRHRHKYN